MDARHALGGKEMRMEVTSLRLPPGMLVKLTALASVETLRRGRRVTWAGLVREVVERHLLQPNAGLAGVQAGAERLTTHAHGPFLDVSAPA